MPGNVSGDAAPVVEYLAGGWVGIVGPGMWLLVEADPGDPFVQQCWRSICAGARANELLGALHDRPADEVRGFVLVAVDGESTRAAARGNSSIRLQQKDNGPVTLVLGEVSGGPDPARTVDRLYDWPAVTFRLAAGYESAWPPQEGQPVLPVAAGTVLATAVSGRPRTAQDPADVLDSRRGQGESAQGAAAAEAEAARDVEPIAAEPAAFEVRDFDFELTPAQSAADPAQDVLFVATPLFADDADSVDGLDGPDRLDGPDDAADSAGIGQSEQEASEAGESLELEFGFASIPPVPEPDHEDELFGSAANITVRPPNADVSDEEIMAELTGTSTGFTAIPAIPVPEDDEDPDFAPTMLVPTRPAMPPVPEPPDPDALPTMIVPIPVPDNGYTSSLYPSVPDDRSGQGDADEDPDFAPTMLVPARPTPTPLPPTPAPASVNDHGPDDLDFAPTMLVPKPPSLVQNPVHAQPPADDLAPPVGPRFDIGVASNQPVQPVQPAPAPAEAPTAAADPIPSPAAEDGADQESDADMIWKLDWWHSSHNESGEPEIESEPQTAPPSQQPQQAQQPQNLQQPQPSQQPHLPPPMHQPPTPAPQPTAYQPQPPFEVEDDTSMTVPRPSSQSSPESDAAGRPLVPAVRCPSGHLNPPQATNCRVCAIPVPPQASYQIPQPVLGVLRLSTGGDVPLDRDVFLGRDPSSTEERKARKPHMLRLPSPGKDISRDHLEIRLVGWRVMVIDLGSTNGTMVIAPGGRPEALAAGGSRMIEPGTQVVLAEEVSLVYEVTS